MIKILNSAIKCNVVVTFEINVVLVLLNWMEQLFVHAHVLFFNRTRDF